MEITLDSSPGLCPAPPRPGGLWNTRHPARGDFVHWAPPAPPRPPGGLRAPPRLQPPFLQSPFLQSPSSRAHPSPRTYRVSKPRHGSSSGAGEEAAAALNKGRAGDARRAGRGRGDVPADTSGWRDTGREGERRGKERREGGDGAQGEGRRAAGAVGEPRRG